jgi:tetratricopeptide (TPR) repeat protein
MTHIFKRSGLRAFHAGLHLAARHAAGAVLALAACSLWAAPLDDIRRQVESSQFDQAYQTAQSNPQLHGDVHFDFLYGVAAINVGRVAEGVLALERHLAAVPANDRARLELARGYYLVGEYARARSEFEFVLRYNPPAGVRENIARYLQAMALRENASRAAVRESGPSSAPATTATSTAAPSATSCCSSSAPSASSVRRRRARRTTSSSSLPGYSRRCACRRGCRCSPGWRATTSAMSTCRHTT